MGMLQIGSVAFTITGPHYDKLKHSMKADWARQKRFGRRDALQFTGLGEESVTVTGTIYPDYFNGFDALATLRSLMPQPQMVISGAGDVFGLWCIVDVGNEQSYQDSSGAPRKVTFDINLERYGEDGLGFGFLGLDIGSAASALVSRLW